MLSNRVLTGYSGDTTELINGVEVMGAIKLLRESGYRAEADAFPHTEFTWGLHFEMLCDFFESVRLNEPDEGDTLTECFIPIPELTEDEKTEILHIIADNIGHSVFSLEGAGYTENNELYIWFYPGQLPDPAPLQTTTFIILVKRILDKAEKRMREEGSHAKDNKKDTDAVSKNS